MTVHVAKVHPISRLDTPPSSYIDVEAQHRPNVAARVIVLALLFLAVFVIGTLLFAFSGADIREIYSPYFVT